MRLGVRSRNDGDLVHLAAAACPAAPWLQILQKRIYIPNIWHASVRDAAVGLTGVWRGTVSRFRDGGSWSLAFRWIGVLVGTEPIRKE